jgi:hypothetical protein
MEISERNALAGQSVNIRGADDWITGTGEFPVSLVIGHYYDEIGIFGFILPFFRAAGNGDNFQCWQDDSKQNSYNTPPHGFII